MPVFTQKRILRDEDFRALDLFADSREGFPVSKVSGILAIAAFALAGCITDEPIDPYSLKHGNGGIGTWCRITHEVGLTQVDSLATCSDGSAPRLTKAEWLSTSGTCTIADIKDVRGGLSGIRRYFGCGEPIKAVRDE